MNLHQYAETHQVTNQPPSLDGVNLYRIDLLRRERVDAVLLGCPLARITATSKDAQLLTLAVCLQLPVLAVFESAAEAQAARGQVDAITDALIKPLGIDDVQHALAQRLLVVGEGKSAGS